MLLENDKYRIFSTAVMTTAVLILLTLCSFAQNVVIIDSLTKDPIEYAHLVYLKNKKQIGGLYTDMNGLAFIDGDQSIDSILITCVGYSNKIVRQQKLKDTLTLKQKAYKLEEVLVQHDGEELTLRYLGTSRDKKTGSNRSYTGHKELVYIVNPYNYSKAIKKFYLELSKKFTGSDYLVRLLFYENNNGKPGVQIQYDKKIVLNREMKRKVFVDISEGQLILPPEGLFVGLERLGCLDENSEGKDCQLVTTAVFSYKKVDCLGRTYANHPEFVNRFFDTNKDSTKGFCYLPVYGILVVE